MNLLRESSSVMSSESMRPDDSGPAARGPPRRARTDDTGPAARGAPRSAPADDSGPAAGGAPRATASKTRAMGNIVLNSIHDTWERCRPQINPMLHGFVNELNDQGFSPAELKAASLFPPYLNLFLNLFIFENETVVIYFWNGREMIRSTAEQIPSINVYGKYMFDEFLTVYGRMSQSMSSDSVEDFLTSAIFSDMFQTAIFQDPSRLCFQFYMHYVLVTETDEKIHYFVDRQNKPVIVYTHQRLWESYFLPSSYAKCLDLTSECRRDLEKFMARPSLFKRGSELYKSYEDVLGTAPEAILRPVQSGSPVIDLRDRVFEVRVRVLKNTLNEIDFQKDKNEWAFYEEDAAENLKRMFREFDEDGLKPNDYQGISTFPPFISPFIQKHTLSLDEIQFKVLCGNNLVDADDAPPHLKIYTPRIKMKMWGGFSAEMKKLDRKLDMSISLASSRGKFDCDLYKQYKVYFFKEESRRSAILCIAPFIEGYYEDDRFTCFLGNQDKLIIVASRDITMDLLFEIIRENSRYMKVTPQFLSDLRRFPDFPSMYAKGTEKFYLYNPTLAPVTSQPVRPRPAALQPPSGSQSRVLINTVQEIKFQEDLNEWSFYEWNATESLKNYFDTLKSIGFKPNDFTAMSTFPPLVVPFIESHTKSSRGIPTKVFHENRFVDTSEVLPHLNLWSTEMKKNVWKIFKDTMKKLVGKLDLNINLALICGRLEYNFIHDIRFIYYVRRHARVVPSLCLDYGNIRVMGYLDLENTFTMVAIPENASSKSSDILITYSRYLKITPEVISDVRDFRKSPNKYVKGTAKFYLYNQSLAPKTSDPISLFPPLMDPVEAHDAVPETASAEPILGDFAAPPEESSEQARTIRIPSLTARLRAETNAFDDIDERLRLLELECTGDSSAVDTRAGVEPRDAEPPRGDAEPPRGDAEPPREAQPGRAASLSAEAEPSESQPPAEDEDDAQQNPAMSKAQKERQRKKRQAAAKKEKERQEQEERDARIAALATLAVDSALLLQNLTDWLYQQLIDDCSAYTIAELVVDSIARNIESDILNYVMQSFEDAFVAENTSFAFSLTQQIFADDFVHSFWSEDDRTHWECRMCLESFVFNDYLDPPYLFPCCGCPVCLKCLNQLFTGKAVRCMKCFCDDQAVTGNIANFRTPGVFFLQCCFDYSQAPSLTPD